MTSRFQGSNYIKTLRHSQDGSHSPLVWILYHKYFKRYLTTDSVAFVERKNEYLADLSNEIYNNLDKSIIISSEILPTLQAEGIDELLSFFPHMTTKVIFYIRDISSTTLSLASQIVKLQQSRVDDDRLSTIDDHLKYFYFYYPQCLKLWESRIGKANMIFRKYSMEHFRGEYICRHSGRHGI